MKQRKVVINACFGGFGLSEAAYEKLIEWGVPVRKYIHEPRNPETGLFDRVPENEGEIIFDNDLITRGENESHDRLYWEFRGKTRMATRYWDTWTRNARAHPLIVRVVEELGAEANGWAAELKVVEIPADVEYTVEEYDGNEHIAEVHRTWP